jgi:CHASE3 domain sensor protein
MLAAMLGAVTVWLSARIEREEKNVRHTLAVQNHVARILSLAQHVETNQRGYLLTGAAFTSTPTNMRKENLSKSWTKHQSSSLMTRNSARPSPVCDRS